MSVGESVAPLVLINAVGLTPRLLAHAPELRGLAERGWMRPMHEVLPAVTCAAQATLLTGKLPSEHGIVANGWMFRDTREVRFWQQSNALLQAEPLYATAARRAERRGRTFRAAKLFWWFNQGARVHWSLTPKPFYGADGGKAFGISGTPDGIAERIEAAWGQFPFPSFWGPGAGLPATLWIALAAALTVREECPDLTMVYLPHLDYEPQRSGPSGCDMAHLVRELDNACLPLIAAAKARGAAVWVVSEYGHCDVTEVIAPNRALRRARLLKARPGPFGEMVDFFESRAFAACDHQIAHVYVKDPRDVDLVSETIGTLGGVGAIHRGDAREQIGLVHERSGDVIALAKPHAWFAYPYWLDDREAPDFARTVDIHRKPGYDPCELFFDPKLRMPKLRVARRLLQKTLGFRTLFDVVPLDARVVRGSHGLVSSGDDGPILIGTGEAPTAPRVPMTGVRDLILAALDLAGD